MFLHGHDHPHHLLRFTSDPGGFTSNAGAVLVIGDLTATSDRVLLDVKVVALATTAGRESVAYGAVSLGVLHPGETVPFELELTPLGEVAPAFVDLYARCAAVTLPCLPSAAPSAPF